MSTIDINIDDQNTSIKINWWTFIIRGILAFIFAVLAFFMPVSALMALTFVFGAFAFLDGILSIIAAVRNIRKGGRWGWLLAGGTLSILAGIIVLVAPLVATIVVASFLWASISLWSIFIGIVQLMTAIRLRKEVQGEIWLSLNGVFSILFGGFIMWMLLSQPQDVLLASGWLLGLNALFTSFFFFFLGFQLKKAQGK